MTEASVDPFLPLRDRVVAAVRAAFPEVEAPDAALHRSVHADYQADVALALARRLGKPPREVAAAVAAHLVPDDADCAGGRLRARVHQHHADERVPRRGARAHARRRAPGRAAGATRGSRSSSTTPGPNVAKEMHVGHLRSTIIGDALARLLEWQGHDVIRQNHIGDWGTPFGMLIEHLLDSGDRQAGGIEASLRELVAFYQAARAKFDQDPAFADRARHRVVLLQGGDAETLALWRKVVDVSIEHMDVLYQRLGVTLGPAHVAGESTYNAILPIVVAELQDKGLARESEGAICVFPPGFTGREGEPVPLILRKGDGGFGYATTDLAALRYRVSPPGGVAAGLRRRRAAGAAPGDGVRGGPAGGVGGARRAARARGVRLGARPRQEDVQDAGRGDGAAGRPARRSLRARDPHGAGEGARSRRRRRCGRSPRRWGSGPSSTPTCRTIA